MTARVPAARLHRARPTNYPERYVVNAGSPRERASRRLRTRNQSVTDNLLQEAFDAGRESAAVDVLVLASTFESGFVWADEAARAALGSFSTATAEGGIAEWAVACLGADNRALVEGRLAEFTGNGGDPQP